MLLNLELHYIDVSDEFYNIYFVFGYACFMCICLRTAIWFILTFFETRSDFFGEPDRVS